MNRRPGAGKIRAVREDLPAGKLLWRALLRRRALVVDVAILLVFCFIQIATWIEVDVSPRRAQNPTEAAERLRDTATGGLTVVGILVPLTALAIQLRITSLENTLIRARESVFVLVDFFVSSAWLLISLGIGLYILYFVAYRGYVENLLTYRHIGVLVAFQLFFLLVGVLRFVWGMGTLISGLLVTKSDRRISDDVRSATFQ